MTGITGYMQVHQVIVLHTLNSHGVSCHLYLSKAGKKKGRKPEDLLERSRNVCDGAWPLRTKQLCRVSLHLGAGVEERG